MGAQGDVTRQEDELSGRELAGSGNRNTRQDDDVRKTNGIRFNGINQQDLRKKLGCQQEWNKPGRLGTTPGAEITLQDVKFKRKNGKGNTTDKVGCCKADKKDLRAEFQVIPEIALAQRRSNRANRKTQSNNIDNKNL